jgi:hypothetical protein
MFKSANMTFKGYYKGLIVKPHIVFKNNVIKKCKVNETTFYNWLDNKTTPKKAHRQILAQMTGIKESKLFPMKKMHSND